MNVYVVVDHILKVGDSTRNWAQMLQMINQVLPSSHLLLPVAHGFCSCWTSYREVSETRA
jgi:hypothetical protein